MILKCLNKWGEFWNNTIPFLLLLSCSTRTGSHWFSRCWVLLSITSLKNMFVLNIWDFKYNQNYFRCTEKLKILYLMISQVLAYKKLIKIVSFYGFVQGKNPLLIFTCRSKVVSYYLSKCSVVLNQYSQALKNVPLRAKQHIHATTMFDICYIISCSTKITSF